MLTTIDENWAAATLLIDGVSVGTVSSGNGSTPVYHNTGAYDILSGIVPSSKTYTISASASIGLYTWSELR